MIFQEHHLLARRSAFDNVAVPLWVSGIGPSEIRKRVRAALDKVSLLHKEHAIASTLSSGNASASHEPTGNLDPTLSREIIGLFEQFNRVGVTVVIATHDTEVLRLHPRRTIELREGSVVSGAGES